VLNFDWNYMRSTAQRGHDFHQNPWSAQNMGCEQQNEVVASFHMVLQQC